MEDPRLFTDRNLWLATTRPDGRPHLVPIWFCYLGDKFYVCTQESVKVRNLRANPFASVALQDGDRPVIAEGAVRFVERPFPADIVRAFQDKYQWSLDDGRPPAQTGTYNMLIEITPAKWLTW